MSDPLADGLDEARRGLWRSAIESFDAAGAAHPDDPGPALAAAICLLERGQIDEALLRLEASPQLVAATGVHRLRRDWLRIAARLRSGDVLGAERGCASLPPALARRARAQIALSQADYATGVRLLLPDWPGTRPN